MESLFKIAKDLLYGSIIIFEDNILNLNYKQIFLTINFNTMAISIIKETEFDLINILVRIPSNYIDIIKLRKIIDVTGEKWIKE
jgi:hypothetical protein